MVVEIPLREEHKLTSKRAWSRMGEKSTRADLSREQKKAWRDLEKCKGKCNTLEEVRRCMNPKTAVDKAVAMASISEPEEVEEEEEEIEVSEEGLEEIETQT